MVKAYGFPDIDFNGNSSVHSKDGSSYFFVPQVEFVIKLLTCIFFSFFFFLY